MEPLPLLASIAAGAAVILIAYALAGSRRQDPTNRLDDYRAAVLAQQAAESAPRSAAADAASHSILLSSLNRLVESRTWADNIARDMARADLALRPVEYIVLRAGAIGLAILVCYVLGLTIFGPLTHPLALALAAVAGLLLPRIWIERRKAARIRAFNAQLPDTITLIANALRVGSSFLQSVELAIRESGPPISTEFGRVVREVTLGLTLEQALNNLVRRVRSDDLELMATAVTIQHQVGGNLADILDAISFTIRDRVRIKGEIRTLTAQQRLSGYIVGFLPIAILAMLMVVSPRFINPMFQQPPDLLGIPLGVALLILGGVLMGLGFVFIRRIVDIEI